MIFVQQSPSKRWFVGSTLLVLSLALTNPASADLVTVSATNEAPDSGTYITPVWVGFHNGSWDTFDSNSAASLQLSRLAEDGNTAPISQTFDSGGSLLNTGVSQSGSRVQGTLLGLNDVIAPGETVSMQFDIDFSTGGDNQFLSFASMVLPTNDYFIGNGDPTAIDLSGLDSGDITATADRVYDAGTEVNDFNTSAGNGLFPGLGLPQGQTGPNQGADEFGVVKLVNFPFLGFANTPPNADTLPEFGSLNFQSAAYGEGLASITITRTVVAAPEPGSTCVLLGLAGVLLGIRRRGK